MGRVIRYPNLIGMLFAILLFTSLVLPPIRLLAGLPKFHATEIFLPFLVLACLINKPILQLNILRKDLWIQFGIGICILFSMAMNQRLFNGRDWFELFEVGKYLILLVFISHFAHLADLKKIFVSVFFVLLLFNLIHYFDLFGFNHLVETYYGSDIQVSTFGLNSLGQPDTKRLLGTLGNPNNNAILFLFFSIYFFPTAKEKVFNMVLFLLSVSLMLMCQSRTTTVSFLLIFALGAYIRNLNLKNTIGYSLYFAFVYWLLWKGGNTYLSSLAGNPIKQTSVKGRMETFRILGKMILKSPIAGHAPNKEFFDTHQLNSDNEYLLYTWRYGFVGLILYLAWLIRLAILGWKSKLSTEGFHLLLFMIGLGVSAITNSPLSNPYLLFLLAIFAGMFFNRQIQPKTT